MVKKRVIPKTTPRHKWGAVQTIRDGMKFPSKKEAHHYDELKVRVKAGEVCFFLRQVPIHLPGGGTMRIDFLEFWADGTAHFVDTKGKRTQKYKTKKRIVEALYPFEIEER